MMPLLYGAVETAPRISFEEDGDTSQRGYRGFGRECGRIFKRATCGCDSPSSSRSDYSWRGPISGRRDVHKDIG